MNKSNARIKGRVKLTIRDKNGNVREKTDWMYNTITNTALAELSGLAGNTGSKTAFTYLALGTDSTAPAATQTALLAEITDSGLSRASATVSQVTTTQTNDTLQLVHTWTATATKVVEEVGVFNASSGGTMAGRSLTGTKTVNSGETIEATYQIIFS